jgi:hypothetical protein
LVVFLLFVRLTLRNMVVFLLFVRFCLGNFVVFFLGVLEESGFEVLCGDERLNPFVSLGERLNGVIRGRFAVGGVRGTAENGERRGGRSRLGEVDPLFQGVVGARGNRLGGLGGRLLGDEA